MKKIENVIIEKENKTFIDLLYKNFSISNVKNLEIYKNIEAYKKLSPIKKDLIISRLILIEEESDRTTMISGMISIFLILINTYTSVFEIVNYDEKTIILIKTLIYIFSLYLFTLAYSNNKKYKSRAKYLLNLLRDK